MRYKICLHALSVKNKGQLQELVKKSWPLSAEKAKQKEKYCDEDFVKYKRVKFEQSGNKMLRIVCISGVMVVRDRMQPVNDIIIEFERQAADTVRRILKKLLASKVKFVLEEPDLRLRMLQRRGDFRVWDAELYDAEDATTVLRAHLPIQVYEISKLWGSFSSNPGDKTAVRQLRVRLRRLRSALVLFKPLLPVAQAELWKQTFKSWTDVLGDAREYDVALMTCAKIRNSRKDNKVMELEKALLECRKSASKKATGFGNLNNITGHLAGFLLSLYNTQSDARYSEMKIRFFLRQRLSEWSDRLQSFEINDAVMEDMEALHRIRIKIKRFRYALLTAAEISYTGRLMRSLKLMQDTLGLLHDNYVNDQLIAGIMRQHEDNSELRYEGAMFCGWDSARRENILSRLPEMWEDFCGCLQEWQEEYL